MKGGGLSFIHSLIRRWSTTNEARRGEWAVALGVERVVVTNNSANILEKLCQWQWQQCSHIIIIIITSSAPFTFCSFSSSSASCSCRVNAITTAAACNDALIFSALQLLQLRLRSINHHISRSSRWWLYSFYIWNLKKKGSRLRSTVGDGRATNQGA